MSRASSRSSPPPATSWSRSRWAKLAGSASQAARTLTRLLAADNEHVRLRAARTILEQLLRLREAVELAERVATLDHA